MKKRTHRYSRRRSRNPTLPELEQLPEGGLARSKIIRWHVCAGAPISTHPLSTALLHDSTLGRVEPLSQPLVHGATAYDFGLPSSAIWLRV